MRIGFFAHFPFHQPILQPIHDAVALRAACLLASDPSALVAFQPHMLVMASHAHLEYFRERLPGAATVNVRHGLVSKRGLERLPARKSARWFDFVCVGGEGRIAPYELADASPREYWLTGYPQLDPLFRGDPPPPLPMDRGKQTVLYAPTWNLGLSSAGMLGPRLVELIRGQAPDVNIIIKPHPVIGDWRPRWMACWDRLEATSPGVHLVRATHADITPYMLAADLLISDASSAIFEFLALDRPIVLVTNPRHAADPACEPRDIVWTWRDVGEEIHDVAALPAAVARALRCPDARGERRRHYARTLFGAFTDGRSHLRIAERLLAVGAAMERGEMKASTLRVPRTSAPARLSHELRTRLWASRSIRRLVSLPLEALRLRLRGLGGRPRRSPAPPRPAGPDHG